MPKTHEYTVNAKWTGNTGKGTDSYRGYERSLTISAEGKTDIFCTSDTAFNGDKTKHNPEQLLLASISSCHLLWYLHVCSEAGVIVLAYEDRATARMIENTDGSGFFEEATLYPEVLVQHQSMIEKAIGLHEKAHRFCYIASSCNFPIRCKPDVKAVDN
jgi:organic hydroperoxide reductase OsmC/OhrA